MVASGAGQDSKLTIRGSNVKAGNNIQLSADDKIDLLAGKNTSEQHSTNKSSGASIGASFGTDGVLLTTSASRARGKAEGHDVTWSATPMWTPAIGWASARVQIPACKARSPAASRSSPTWAGT